MWYKIKFKTWAGCWYCLNRNRIEMWEIEFSYFLIKFLLCGNYWYWQFISSHGLICRIIEIWHLYLKLEQGWIIQWPIAFCRTLSFIKAFFEPNNFIANLLSVGAKMFWSWFLTQPGFDSLETEFLRKKDLTFIIFYPLWGYYELFKLNYFLLSYMM